MVRLKFNTGLCLAINIAFFSVLSTSLSNNHSENAVLILEQASLTSYQNSLILIGLP